MPKKMNRRAPIKKKHERYLVNCYLEWLKVTTGVEFSIIEEPDPPEAIIASANQTTWVEVVDVFYSDDLAKDKYSYVTPGEKHQPMGTGPYVSMDEQFSNRFIQELRKKITKTTYVPFREKYGRGTLLIGIHHPWFNEETVCMMKEAYLSEDWNDSLDCFYRIYYSFSSMNKKVFKLWPDEA
jgi:hypothetical protein